MLPRLMSGETQNEIGRLALLFAIALAAVAVCHAQRRASPPGEPGDTPEDAYYKAWDHTRDADKKTKLGEQFVQSYPNSARNQKIYDQMVMFYEAKQDWIHFYAASDKALAQFPDDVTILAVTGWVIPCLYSADDPDADKRLEKAETYEKRALQLVPSLVKAPGAKQAEFESVQKATLAMAHSGLGLVYFRKTSYQESVAQLEEATRNAPSPDPIAFYALGVGLEHLNRYAEAADAYQKCSQTPGGPQASCKESAERMNSQAAAAK